MNTVIITDNTDKFDSVLSVWGILSAAYAGVKGGLHFSSPKELVHKTSRWDLIMNNGVLVAVVLYKNKHGLKISAFGCHRDYKASGIPALIEVVSCALAYAWIEVSEKAERFIINQCGGHQYIISNSFTHQLLDNPFAYEADGYHYRRNICGLNKAKMMIGTPQLTLLEKAA